MGAGSAAARENMRPTPRPAVQRFGRGSLVSSPGVGASRRFLDAAHPDHRGGGRLAGLLHRRSCAVAHPAPRHRRRVLLQRAGPPGRRRQGLPEPVRVLRAGRQPGAPHLPHRGASAALHRLPRHPRQARPLDPGGATRLHRAPRRRHRLPDRDPGPAPRRRPGRAHRRRAGRPLPCAVVERLDARSRIALRHPRRAGAARAVRVLEDTELVAGRAPRAVVGAGDAHPFRGHHPVRVPRVARDRARAAGSRAPCAGRCSPPSPPSAS